MAFQRLRLRILFAFFVASATWARRYDEFRAIGIDVRDNYERGGQGDVTAGYLFALELVEKHHVKAPITLITNRHAERILSTLSGDRVSHGSILSNGKILIQNYDELKEETTQPFDLLVHLARPTGTDYIQSDYSIDDSVATRAKTARHGLDLALPRSQSDAKLKLSQDAFVIVHTVLGNTEGEGSSPFSFLAHRGRPYFIRTAGFDVNDAGVYRDVTALPLRDKDEIGVKASLLELLDQHNDYMIAGTDYVQKKDGVVLSNDGVLKRDFYAFLKNYLRGGTLEGAEPGFAYGLASIHQNAQFEEYIKVLSQHARASGKAYVIFTPTSRGTKSRGVVVLDHATRPKLPQQAKPGTVYVFRTPKIPNALFNHFLALSRIPPIVAGDGAVSAARSIGRPFLMSAVSWNLTNMRVIARLLQYQSRNPTLRQKVHASFSSYNNRHLALGLSYFLQDPHWADKLYENLEDATKDLSDSNQELISVLDRYHSGELSFDGVLSTASDPVFRTSFVVNEHLERNRAATILLREILLHKNADEILKFRRDWGVTFSSEEIPFDLLREKIFDRHAKPSKKQFSSVTAIYDSDDPDTRREIESVKSELFRGPLADVSRSSLFSLAFWKNRLSKFGVLAVTDDIIRSQNSRLKVAGSGVSGETEPRVSSSNPIPKKNIQSLGGSFKWLKRLCSRLFKFGKTASDSH